MRALSSEVVVKKVEVNRVRSGLLGLIRQRVAVAVQRRIAYAVVVGLVPVLVQACASPSPVEEAGDPGRYTLHASASGGSVAWARSHKAVIQSASDFCEQRGQMLSVVSETSKGVRALEKHEADLTFECHARF
ncbi:hypothetical protein [Paraburkholderia bengalensis]|uniref:hypothetical protein n=1 Tax=Paraburkholderia bengalensis TaxID=2747562 RepID=UPI003014DB99